MPMTQIPRLHNNFQIPIVYLTFSDYVKKELSGEQLHENQMTTKKRTEPGTHFEFHVYQ